MATKANMTGAAWMAAAMASFALNDASIKTLSGEVPLFQALVLRSVLAAILVGLWAWRAGAFRPAIGRADRGLITLRALLETAAAFLFLMALFNMPLATLTAILQALPLVVTLGAALVFGDTVGWRRLTAICVGCVGVLLIVQPGFGDFTGWSLLGVACVLLAAIRDLATRRLSPEVPSLLVTFWTTVAVLVFSGLMSLREPWVVLELWHIGRIAISTVFIIAAYIAVIQGMRIGEIAFVAPFRYTGLLVALAAGYVVFGDWPNALALSGAGIVVGSGLYTLWREARQGRRTPAVDSSRPLT